MSQGHVESRGGEEAVLHDGRPRLHLGVGGEESENWQVAVRDAQAADAVRDVGFQG